MNKLIKIAVLIFVIFGSATANNTPTEGATLQVIATSGLKLRMEPNMESGTLTIMPFGAEVTLLEFEPNEHITRVDWIDGKWMKVEYNGRVGWAFDGFLTILNVPSHELEKCYEDLDLAFPLEFWARANFGATKIDTMTDERTFVRTRYSLVNQQELVVTEKDLSTKIELYLQDVRVMEVYQLLQSMISVKDARKVFEDASLFIEKDGTIKHIKIDVGGGIDIRESYDGKVRIVINSFHSC